MVKHLIWPLAVMCCSVNAGEILAIDRGLTLAEISTGRVNTLLVLEDHDSTVSAINLSETTGVAGGIVETFQRLGFEGIEQAAATAQPSEIRQYRHDELLSPAGDGGHHIALGFNYREHADEIEEEHEPFLFLKTVDPTREASIPTAPDVLLDYESEICFRPMSDLQSSAEVSEAAFGIFLCGDFTDRAELLRGLDLDNMRSGRGFSPAKSKPGYFPTGRYLVIPKDRKAFLDDLSFALWVNGEQKQSAVASETIWPLDRMIEELFAADQADTPTHTSEADQWLPDGQLETDVTILSGTPEGVIMRPPSLWFKFTSGIGYVATGSFLETDVQSYAIHRYINALLRKKVFLQPGDHIRMEGRHLGDLEVAVEG